MKDIKSLFLLIVFMTVGTTIFGQENKFEIGIEGNPSLTLLWGNDVFNLYHKPTIGFSAGLFFQYNINKTIALRTDIAYERKGSVLKGELMGLLYNPIGENKIHINFDYITVPILIKFSLGKKLDILLTPDLILAI